MADGLIADFILCSLEWQTFFFFCLHPPVRYRILRLETEREPCGLGSMAMGGDEAVLCHRLSQFLLRFS